MRIFEEPELECVRIYSEAVTGDILDPEIGIGPSDPGLIPGD